MLGLSRQAALTSRFRFSGPSASPSNQPAFNTQKSTVLAAYCAVSILLRSDSLVPAHLCMRSTIDIGLETLCQPEMRVGNLVQRQRTKKPFE